MRSSDWESQIFEKKQNKTKQNKKTKKQKIKINKKQKKLNTETWAQRA